MTTTNPSVTGSDPLVDQPPPAGAPAPGPNLVKGIGGHAGKIARLPRAVRDKLNRRLDDGEDGASLLAWLNRLPDTRQVLAAHFRGQPVNKQNLSDWRHGGFLDWRRQEEARVLAFQLLEDAGAVAEATGSDPVAERLSVLGALALGHLLQEARSFPIGPERTRMILGVIRELIRLRQADRRFERSQRDARDCQNRQDDRQRAAGKKTTDEVFSKMGLGNS